MKRIIQAVIVVGSIAVPTTTFASEWDIYNPDPGAEYSEQTDIKAWGDSPQDTGKVK